MSGLKQIKCNLSCTYQTADIGLEIQSQAELDSFLEALQNQKFTWIALHDQRRSVNLHIYLRFREGRSVTAQQEETEAVE